MTMLQNSFSQEENSRLRIIVCGGGIAGFATALLLREDHDVIVLESSKLNEEIGAAITLSMNATRLLRSSLARAGFDHVRARYVEANKVDTSPLNSLICADYRSEVSGVALAKPLSAIGISDGSRHEEVRPALVVFLS